MTLEDLGYNTELENYRIEQKLDSFDVGRVVSEHKDRYMVKTPEKEYQAEIIGNLRFSANDRSDFPAVGDWVAISEYEEDKVLIHVVFPRKSSIERQAVGKHGEKQIIATNIDFAFIIQAVDRDFNINRIERYLTLCHTSHVSPVVILNKIDLISDSELTKKVAEVKVRIKDAPIVCLSNTTKEGLDELHNTVEKGKTYCLLGSSGVGKSTLMNNLSGRQMMKTDAISMSTQRGRHETSHRELLVLEKGGILIDNPGMREVGIADSSEGLTITFDTINDLSTNCRFVDCTHTVEKGCAVLKALNEGNLDLASYENFVKMEREKTFFESTVAEKRKKDKDFGKMVRNFRKRYNN